MPSFISKKKMEEFLGTKFKTWLKKNELYNDFNYSEGHIFLSMVYAFGVLLDPKSESKKSLQDLVFITLSELEYKNTKKYKHFI